MSEAELLELYEQELKLRRQAQANVEKSEKKIKKYVKEEPPQTILRKAIKIDSTRVQKLTDESVGLFLEFQKIRKQQEEENKKTSSIGDLLKQKKVFDEQEVLQLVYIKELRQQIKEAKNERYILNHDDEDLTNQRELTIKKVKKICDYVHSETLKKNSLDDELNSNRTELIFRLKYQEQLNRECKYLNEKFLYDLDKVEELLVDNAHQKFDEISARFRKLKGVQAALPQIKLKHREKTRRRIMMINELKEIKKFVLLKNKTRPKRQSNPKLTELKEIISDSKKKIWNYATILKTTMDLVNVHEKDLDKICLAIRQIYVRNYDVLYQLLHMKKLVETQSKAMARITKQRQQEEFHIKNCQYSGMYELDDYRNDILNLKQKITNVSIQLVFYEFLPKIFYKKFGALFRLIQITHDVIPIGTVHIEEMDYTNYDFVLTKLEQQIVFLLCKLYHLEKDTPIEQLRLQVPIYKIVPKLRKLKRAAI